MKRFLSDIEPGDTFRVAGTETPYLAYQVRTDAGKTQVTYKILGSSMGLVEMTKPSLTHVLHIL